MVDIARLKPLKASLQGVSWPASDSQDSAATQKPANRDFTREELAARILARIESRLPNRIRRLAVTTEANAIVLSGECSTFYTKQMAQHVAMGVLEFDRLINNIDVCPLK